MAVINLLWYALQMFEGFGSELPHATRLVVSHDQASGNSAFICINKVNVFSSTQLFSVRATMPAYGSQENHRYMFRKWTRRRMLVLRGKNKVRREAYHASSSRSDSSGFMAVEQTLAKAVCRRMFYTRAARMER
jgi:hypothetical protein